MLANSISFSRIPLSLCLLALSSTSPLFAILYFLCGATDVLDGFLARKLHTESRTGERLDSIADLFFACAYASKILPLFHLPIWIWLWTALIAAVKISGILIRHKEDRRYYITHSTWNKLTGLMIFLLPAAAHFTNIKYSAAAVCAAASMAAAEEFFRLKGIQNEQI